MAGAAPKTDRGAARARVASRQGRGRGSAGRLKGPGRSAGAAGGRSAAGVDWTMARREASATLSPAHHDHRHPRQGQARPEPVAGPGFEPVHAPQPQQGHRDVDPAIRRIDPAGSRRMQAEQPREQGQAGGTRQQPPGAAPLAEPEAGQVAADDLGQGGEHEEAEGFQKVHGRGSEPDPCRRQPEPRRKCRNGRRCQSKLGRAVERRRSGDMPSALFEWAA